LGPELPVSPIFESSGSVIDGWGSKVALIESGPEVDRATGSIVVADSVAGGQIVVQNNTLRRFTSSDLLMNLPVADGGGG